MHNTTKVGIILLMLGMLFCAQEKTPFYVWGIAEIHIEEPAPESFTMVNVVSDPIPEEATVKVNGVSLKRTNAVLFFSLSPGLYFMDTTTALNYGTTYNLDVECEAGKCNASAKMSGSFTVIAPDNISPNSDLTLSWSKADDAMWYYVWIYYYGYTTNASFDTFFVTADTQVTLSGEFFSEEGGISWEIGAGNGPSYGWEAGSEGNIEGDGFGFWSAMVVNEGFTDVGEGSKKTLKKESSLPEQEKLRNLLKCFAPYNKDAQAILEMITKTN